MPYTPILESLVRQMLDAHTLALRDIEGGDEPFEYSSGNHGPGYLMVKGLVSQTALMEALVYNTAVKVLEEFPDIEYVSGNATGGMVPGWIMHQALSKLTGRHIPYFYVRGTRKLGGHGELLTGDKNNDFFATPRTGLVVEELVNFATTTTNSALAQREAGHVVNHAATLMFYGHEHAIDLLNDTNVRLIHLFTVSEFLDIAVRTGADPRLVNDYRAFLADPSGWQRSHGFEPV